MITAHDMRMIALSNLHLDEDRVAEIGKILHDKMLYQAKGGYYDVNLDLSEIISEVLSGQGPSITGYAMECAVMLIVGEIETFVYKVTRVQNSIGITWALCP